MTKDITQYCGGGHKGFVYSRMQTMRLHFKWFRYSQCSCIVASLLSLPLRVMACDVSNVLGMMKELRCSKTEKFTENSAANAWNLNFNNGNFNNNNKTNANSVRPVSAFDSMDAICALGYIKYSNSRTNYKENIKIW